MAGPRLTADSPPERYSPQTLFEIINGDADIYLKAGFVQLEFQRYFLNDDPKQWLEFSAYRMNDHRSAFAVYSVRRGEDAIPEKIARFAYRSRDGLFFVHGPYYVQVIAATESAPLKEAMDHLAAANIQTHKVQVDTIPELERFPPRHLIHHSMALHPAGAFGFRAFVDLFTARYRLAGGEATAFFRQCASPAEAVKLATDYGAFLMEYGGVEVAIKAPLPNGRAIRMEGVYTVVFAHGSVVAGVVDAREQEAAEALAGELAASLRRQAAAD